MEADLARATSDRDSFKERARKLEEDLILVSTERNNHQTEAINQVATTRALGREVDQLKATIQQKEEALAEAVKTAEASASDALAWKTKAMGN